MHMRSIYNFITIKRGKLKESKVMGSVSRFGYPLQNLYFPIYIHVYSLETYVRVLIQQYISAQQ